MRSESMAWLFSRADIKCQILEGGYKSYRKFLLEQLSVDRNIIVIGGYTGSGKTAILKRLKELGEQTVDLEGIANHRGSAFGGLGKDPQPTSEQFANLLYDEIKRFDPARRLFIEDESRSIGSLFMPDEIYSKIRESNIIAICPDQSKRIDHLYNEYGTFSPDKLVESVKKIEKKIGTENLKKAIDSIETGEIREAISIVLDYYDSAYRFGLGKRDPSTISYLDSNSTDPVLNTERIIDLANRIY